MQFNSIRLKVVLAFVAGTLLSMMLVVLIAAHLMQSDVLAKMDMSDMAKDVASQVYFDQDGRPLGLMPEEAAAQWAFDNLGSEVSYRVVDHAGNVGVQSETGHLFWPPDLLPPSPARARFDFERAGVVFYGATEPIINNGKIWFLQVGVSSRMMQLLHRVALPLVASGIALFGMVLLITFGLCAWFTLRYTLKPLQQVSESAASISLCSMHARLKTGAVPLEIAPLVESFNRVLERLEQAYQAQQDFLGNAAHELKTPLAMIRAQVELGVNSQAERASLLRDVAYMTRQVQQLLMLAEASEASNYEFKLVQARDAVQEVVLYLQRMAEAAKVHVVLTALSSKAQWMADRGALFTLLKNLLENAIEHAPAGTAVYVQIGPYSLSVRDYGPGVDSVQLPLLFERFWRGPHRRDHGAGLGLAICQEIVSAHDWTLVAQQAAPGLLIQVSIPVS